MQLHHAAALWVRAGVQDGQTKLSEKRPFNLDQKNNAHFYHGGSPTSSPTVPSLFSDNVYTQSDTLTTTYFFLRSHRLNHVHFKNRH